MRQADRIIVNVLSNYGLTLVGGIASLVMIPIVIGDLGPSGYGLAAMMLATFTITETLGRSITRAIQRYIPQDLANPDRNQVNVTFNSAMACYAVLGLIASCVIWLIRNWYLDDPNVDEALHAEGTYAFALLSTALLIGAPMWAYRAALESIQRFDLVVVHISTMAVLRTLAVIVIFKLGHGSLTVFVVSQLIAVIASYLLCRGALRRSLPQVTFAPSKIRGSALKVLAVFSAGVLLMTAGNVLGLEGFRILIGKGMGMEEAGGLSAVLAFRTMVFMLIQSMTNVLTPAVSTMDAQGMNENVAKLMLTSLKYSAVAAGSICVVPLVVAKSFLELWLGGDFLWLVPLMYVVMLAQIPLAISTSSQQVLLGLGRIRMTGPIIFFRGAGSLAAAGAYIYYAAEPTLVGAAISLYSVQIVGSMLLFLYGCDIVRINRLRAFLDGFGRPLLIALAAAGVTWLLSMQLGANQWWSLMTCIAAGEIVFLALVVTIGLDTEERSRLLGFLGRVKGKLMPAHPAGAGRNDR